MSNRRSFLRGLIAAPIAAPALAVAASEAAQPAPIGKLFPMREISRFRLDVNMWAREMAMEGLRDWTSPWIVSCSISASPVFAEVADNASEYDYEPSFEDDWGELYDEDD